MYACQAAIKIDLFYLIVIDYGPVSIYICSNEFLICREIISIQNQDSHINKDIAMCVCKTLVEMKQIFVEEHLKSIYNRVIT